jgi:hypothetical protein
MWCYDKNLVHLKKFGPNTNLQLRLHFWLFHNHYTNPPINLTFILCLTFTRFGSKWLLLFHRTKFHELWISFLFNSYESCAWGYYNQRIFPCFWMQVVLGVLLLHSWVTMFQEGLLQWFSKVSSFDLAQNLATLYSHA